jgi:hypothetical protein
MTVAHFCLAAQSSKRKVGTPDPAVIVRMKVSCSDLNPDASGDTKASLRSTGAPTRPARTAMEDTHRRSVPIRVVRQACEQLRSGVDRSTYVKAKVLIAQHRSKPRSLLEAALVFKILQPQCLHAIEVVWGKRQLWHFRCFFIGRDVEESASCQDCNPVPADTKGSTPN